MIATQYSPEVFAAHQDLLVARRALGSALRQLERLDDAREALAPIAELDAWAERYPTQDSLEVPVGPETIEKMKALGYLGDDSDDGDE